ncbi:MAG: peptidoglycan editing factor PgeF, partial [Actinomycetia bacterium]|nr:peptidoglycan editing factor PgeF [Actinomycetes bacterium]
PSPYESLNLGAYVGDDPTNVATNRLRILRALDLDENARLRLNSAAQVHGVALQTALDYAFEFSETDALMTDRAAIPLLLCFADCVPIIVVDPLRHAIAVIHSGWRGALRKIAALSIAEMQKTYGSDPAELFAYIGPFIGPQNFEVAAEVASQFLEIFDTISNGDRYTESTGSITIDLGMVVEETLVEMGVRACNIYNMHIDTVTHTGDFFSYRAEDQVTGRFGALGCICS